MVSLVMGDRLISDMCIVFPITNVTVISDGLKLQPITNDLLI